MNGRRLHFDVAGVHRRNMIMQDRETGTLWQQDTGEALHGPLRGERLQPLGGELIRWSEWQALHPYTTLAIEQNGSRRGHQGLIPRSWLLKGLDAIPARQATPGLVQDRRLPMHEEVVGVSWEGQDKAYPLASLRRQGLIHDRLAASPIVLVYDSVSDHVAAFLLPFPSLHLRLTPETRKLVAANAPMSWDRRGRPLTEDTPPLQRLPIHREWWLGWVEFHPRTDIWKG